MKTFSNIVVAIDGSAPSEAAFEAACSLAGDRGGMLTAVFVREPRPSFHAHHIDWAYDDEEARRAGFTALRRAAEAATRKRGLTIETKLLDGDIVDEIVAYAQKIGADTIVVGSHGRTGLQRALVGSVAERFMRTSTIPVLVVVRSLTTADARVDRGVA